MKNFKIIMVGVQEKDNILMGEYKEKEKAIEELKRLKEKDYLHYYEIREEKKEENKKTLLNTKINAEDVEKYAKIIVKKALKVIATNGSIYAIKLLENKDINTLEDLRQEVALQLVLDNYTINKNTFKVVRSYIYKNYEKTEIELFTSEENQENAEENASYISFLSNSNENTKKASKIDLKKLYEKLSATEKKIYKYYFINNMKQKDIAKMTETTKSNINILIKRIKQKAVQCI